MPEAMPSAHLFAGLLVFARVGAAIAVLPGFSSTYVPVRVRLLLALAISVLILPALADTLPPLPDRPDALLVLLLGETLIGLFLGTVPRLLFSALQVAGTFIAFLGGFANALTQDPIADQQSSTISGFFSTLGLVLVLATDLHHLMLQAIVDSYGLFVPGAAVPSGDLAMVVARSAADGFALGVQLAAPFVVIALVYNVGLGLLGRLMPQLQVFFIAQSAQVGLQLWVMVLTISGIMMVFLNRYAEVLGGMLGGWGPPA